TYTLLRGRRVVTPLLSIKVIHIDPTGVIAGCSVIADRARRAGHTKIHVDRLFRQLRRCRCSGGNRRIDLLELEVVSPHLACLYEEESEGDFHAIGRNVEYDL